MEQSSDHNENMKSAYAIAEHLENNGGNNVRALDISIQSSFADAFVLASAESTGQLRGLHRRTHEIISELNLAPRQSHKRDDESGWLLIDCGGIVIHLMIQELREFYDLEKLWYDAAVIYPLST
jgi:ribosome-associated protein